VRIHFFQPRAELRIGGLDAAIQSLRSALQGLGAAVDEQPPDGKGGEIVHFHGLWQPAHARAAKACRALGVPILVSPHGMLEPWAWRHKRWKKWPYFHLVEKRWIARADALLATAPGEARRLREFFPRQRIETLPLGLTGEARPDYKNARRNLKWLPEERVLLFLSRIHVKKGLDLLLRALATMQFPRETRLVIVGEGDESYVGELRRFTRENSSRLPRIDWVGGVWGEARWPYFQGADLFCLPSHSENFGLAVLEACQAGTPALTTVDTPWADDLRDGRGWIGSPAVESIREMLGDFFQKPAATADQREKLSDWAWANFDWKVLGRQYLNLYESLSASPRTAPSRRSP
jgi:glycosyltransferase involved in cell wall biosynthesis